MGAQTNTSQAAPLPSHGPTCPTQVLPTGSLTQKEGELALKLAGKGPGT